MLVYSLLKIDFLVKKVEPYLWLYFNTINFFSSKYVHNCLKKLNNRSIIVHIALLIKICFRFYDNYLCIQLFDDDYSILSFSQINVYV